jgi:hypothetical protein
MTRILAFSGRKQSGKSSAQHLICAAFLANITTEDGGPLVDFARINEQGRIEIPFAKEGEDPFPVDILDINNRKVKEWLSGNLYQFVRNLNFADGVKEICAGAYGLDIDLLNGTEEDKNTTTLFSWDQLGAKPPKGVKKNAFMTYRDLMKFVGNGFREKIDPYYWINRFFDDVYRGESPRIVNADTRFINEVDAILNEGGFVIRFTKRIDDDNDPSESELDDYPNFTAVIDNQNMTIHECHAEVLRIVNELGFFE